jgi:hypothetical protein
MIARFGALSLSGLLASCATRAPEPVASESYPCWLEQPVSAAQTGQIGLARDLDSGGVKPALRARQRALEQLASHLNLQLDVSGIDATQTEFELAGRRFYLADEISRDGYVYSYVTLSPAAPDFPQCAPRSCDINRCEPAWLCAPSDDHTFATLGVSFNATSPVEKEAKAIDNALLQAAFIHGSDVQASKRLFQKSQEDYLYSSLVQTGEVRQLLVEELPHLVTDRCQAQGNLYSRVSFPGLAPLQLNLEHGDIAWIQNPKYQGRHAAVGSTERWTASGLFSDQIKLAIKRALIQLAFENRSDVSEELYTVTYTSGNTLVVTDIREQTAVTLSARVLSFRFKWEDGVFKVYAWVEQIGDGG